MRRLLAPLSSEAESVQRRCSHGVQLRMNVLTAAECTAEAWEAELSVYLASQLRQRHAAPPLISAMEPSHATLVSASLLLRVCRDGAATVCSSE